MVLLTSGVSGYAQLITLLVVFVFVLGITLFTTKWIANYQKQQGFNENIQILETARIANNKYIQIVRVGETIMAIAVCKDTVTMLGEIPKEQLKSGAATSTFAFKELFQKALSKDNVATEGPEEMQLHDEQK